MISSARDLADAFNGWPHDRGNAAWGRRQIGKTLKDRDSVVPGQWGSGLGGKRDPIADIVAFN
jgi:hypothetical protein